MDYAAQPSIPQKQNQIVNTVLVVSTIKTYLLEDAVELPSSVKKLSSTCTDLTLPKKSVIRVLDVSRSNNSVDTPTVEIHCDFGHTAN